MGSLIADALAIAIADEAFAAALEGSRKISIEIDDADACTLTAGSESVTVPFADEDEFMDDAASEVEGVPA
tara:strand:+ start:1327 stop:1539 length:213 start_codon:yes stop_codon:yes gene_type:complete